ncbi:MAG: pyroglutamyl-peptidase I [Firmicutes bacterium]|nr:pyroglutamyl-peptidase I [Bacillota bacterium]
MKILVTGFDAFGGEELNPSQLVLEKLSVAGATVLPMVVPTQFDKGPALVLEALATYNPDWIVMLGQAGGRSQITVERVAINLADAGAPDNAGFTPVDQTLVPEGPIAYFSGLPVKAMVRTIREAGVPAAVSNTAGTFVCNALFYHVQHYLHINKLACRGGFLHIPLLPTQSLDGTKPTMDLSVCCRGLEAALGVLI